MSSDFFYISNNSFLLDLIIMYSGNNQSTKRRVMLLKFDGYARLVYCYPNGTSRDRPSFHKKNTISSPGGHVEIVIFFDSRQFRSEN